MGGELGFGEQVWEMNPTVLAAVASKPHISVAYYKRNLFLAHRKSKYVFLIGKPLFPKL